MKCLTFFTTKLSKLADAIVDPPEINLQSQPGLQRPASGAASPASADPNSNASMLVLIFFKLFIGSSMLGSLGSWAYSSITNTVFSEGTQPPSSSHQVPNTQFNQNMQQGTKSVSAANLNKKDDSQPSSRTITPVISNINSSKATSSKSSLITPAGIYFLDLFSVILRRIYFESRWK